MEIRYHDMVGLLPTQSGRRESIRGFVTIKAFAGQSRFGQPPDGVIGVYNQRLPWCFVHGIDSGNKLQRLGQLAGTCQLRARHDSG